MQNDYYEVILSKGKIAKIDFDDLVYVLGFKWCVLQSGKRQYASTTVDSKTRLLHRAIMRPRPDQVVDHINGDTLDNRKSNLRVCSTSQNSKNRAHTGPTPYKGVSWMNSKGAWRARIKVEYKEIHLGLFDSAEDAATAYNFAAYELHRDFAKFNTVPQPWLETNK